MVEGSVIPNFFVNYMSCDKNLVKFSLIYMLPIIGKKMKSLSSMGYIFKMLYLIYSTTLLLYVQYNLFMLKCCNSNTSYNKMICYTLYHNHNVLQPQINI